MNNEILKCFRCNSEYDCLGILKNCTVYVRAVEGLLFVCPKCKNQFHIGFEKGIFRTIKAPNPEWAYLNGTLQAMQLIACPGTEWKIHGEMQPKDFAFRADPKKMYCWYKGKSYEFIPNQ